MVAQAVRVEQARPGIDLRVEGRGGQSGPAAGAKQLGEPGREESIRQRLDPLGAQPEMGRRLYNHERRHGYSSVTVGQLEVSDRATAWFKVRIRPSTPQRLVDRWACVRPRCSGRTSPQGNRLGRWCHRTMDEPARATVWAALAAFRWSVLAVVVTACILVMCRPANSGGCRCWRSSPTGSLCWALHRGPG